MMPPALHNAVQQKLQQLFSSPGASLQVHPVGGGSINETCRLEFGSQSFFCKINYASKFPQLFQKEMNGLRFIALLNRIQTPSVLDCFEHGGFQVLLLEWMGTGERTENFWKNFGEQLAALHGVSQELYGFHEDNYMGSVPQHNRQCRLWTEFFIQHRLQPMVDRCGSLLEVKHRNWFESLYQKLPQIFSNEQKPALLHGDLWSGNFICNERSEPVLIDPAVYFGHPSVDLGMTTLFGGFSTSFYEAYHYHSPFPGNHKEQWQVANLYPLLIHLFLFGKTYLRQIEGTLQQFA